MNRNLEDVDDDFVEQAVRNSDPLMIIPSALSGVRREPSTWSIRVPPECAHPTGGDSILRPITYPHSPDDWGYSLKYVRNLRRKLLALPLHSGLWTGKTARRPSWDYR